MNYGYYNGDIAPLNELKAPVLDRAFYFGDGVYDVTTYVNGRYFALTDHYERFAGSCRLADINFKMTLPGLTAIFDRLVELTAPEGDALVYFQASRATGERKHSYGDNESPNLFAYVKPIKRVDVFEKVKLITEPDIRFEMCNVKTLNLMPNVLANKKAEKAGCYEAVFHRGQTVTEGSHSSVMLINGGSVVIPPLTKYILPSITRKYVGLLCEKNAIKCEIRTFSLDELYSADEIIVGSASSMIRRASHINGIPCGGKATELYTKLANIYYDCYVNG